MLAVNQASLQGDWRFKTLSIPTALRETYLSAGGQSRQSVDSSDHAVGDEMISDVFFQGGFSTRSGTFNLSQSGSASGTDLDGPSMLELTGARMMQFKMPNQTFDLLINPAGDVMARSHRNDADEFEMAIVVKEPTDAQYSDLAGAWRVLDFGMPNRLTETYLNRITDVSRQSTGPTDDTPKADEQIVDVFFPGGFAALEASVNFAANGFFSGDFSGTVFSSQINGTMVLDDGDSHLHFHLNASKNFMVRELSETGAAEQRFTLLIREPPSTSLSDLAGPWRLTRLSVPNFLAETFTNRVTETSRVSTGSADGTATGTEELVDVEFRGDRGDLTDIVGIADDGTIGGAFTGTLSIVSPAKVTAMINGQAINLYVSSDHGMMWGVISGAEEQELVALMRVPLNPMEVSMQVVAGKVNLLWNGGSTMKMQKSTSLSGWTDITGSTGQSAVQMDAPTFEFYRLVPVP